MGPTSITYPFFSGTETLSSVPLVKTISEPVFDVTIRPETKRRTMTAETWSNLPLLPSPPPPRALMARLPVSSL